MKIHTTMKYIRSLWRKTFRCGYCDLQYIFRYEEPTYYNSGVYGWNCDVYCDHKRDIAITTGYRNMTGRTIPSEVLEKYTNIAKAICEKPFSTPFEETKKALDENRENFLNEIDKL